MANSDGTIYINTEIDASGFDDILKELDKDAQVMSKTAESMGKEISNSFGDGVEGMADPIQNEAVGMQQKLSSLSGSMTKLGGTLSLAFTAPLTALGGKMVDAASDMEENINKVDVAFGKSSESVKAWAETATEAFGLSKNQALEATSLFGDMGTSMGLPQEEAAKMATSMAGLAGDLASFKNIGIDQAMTALNGVFTGETESLKTLGVVMTETNLKQFADDVGIVYDEMTQAEKVQLRYTYVMEMTKNAQGDYARTSDGTANSMRTMSATLDNLIAVFGQSLLPAITPVIQFITDLLTKFSELDPGIQQIIVIIGAVVAAIGPVITAVGGIISVVNTLIPIFSAIIGGLNPVVLIIGAVVAAIALLIANWDNIKATMQAFVEFVKDAFVKDWTESFGVFGNVINTFFDNVQAIWDMVKGIFEGVITFVKGAFTGDWDKAWEGIKKIFSSVFNGISTVCRNFVQTIYNVIIGIVEKIKVKVMNVFNSLKSGIVGIWNGIVTGIKNAINTMIYVLNRMISGVVNGVNNVIGVLNGLSFTIPDWVPEWGGTNFGLNIGYLAAPKIPYLATGAVIPPNAPFMAILGDQRHGTNIEAPLDTIKQAVAEVIGRQRLGGEKMVIHNVTQLNRRILFEAFMDEAKFKQMQTGRNPFDMA